MAKLLGTQNYINIYTPYKQTEGWSIESEYCIGGGQIEVALVNTRDAFTTLEGGRATVTIPDVEGKCIADIRPRVITTNAETTATTATPVSPDYTIQLRTYINGVPFDSRVIQLTAASLVYTRQPNEVDDAREAFYGQKISPSGYTPTIDVPFWRVKAGDIINIRAFVQDLAVYYPTITFDRWIFANGLPSPYQRLNGTTIPDVPFSMEAENLVVDAYFILPPPQSATPTPTITATPSVTPESSPTPTPTTTPFSSIPPDVSVTPSVTPPSSPIPGVSITPTPPSSPIPGVSITPTPTPVEPSRTPVPTPIVWKSCIDGKLTEGNPPSDYIQGIYQGDSGGICWEPRTVVGFTPSLNNLQFTYQRGTARFPAPLNFTAQNPSAALSYRVDFVTNNTFFVVDPPVLNLPPRGQQQFTVSMKNDTINQIDDGRTGFGLEVKITQV